MTALFIAVLTALRASIRSQLELAAEILALRHQLAVLQRTTPKRPGLRPIDRLLSMLLSSAYCLKNPSTGWRPESWSCRMAHSTRDEATRS